MLLALSSSNFVLFLVNNKVYVFGLQIPYTYKISITYTPKQNILILFYHSLFRDYLSPSNMTSPPRIYALS